MSTRALRPWTDLVKLHPDVEGGAITEAVFAIDLGAIAAGDPNVPVVNRDPEAFFRATYLTADLQKLLEEVLASLAGKSGYNRVLKLRTPFGGGKSHTLASLLHASRKREALDGIPEGKGFARPKNVAVGVFDGEKFDARNGKEVEDGRTIRTMWGWLAWQIDPEKAFPIVAEHDQDRVAPGGDVIRDVLTKGAGGRPVLDTAKLTEVFMSRVIKLFVDRGLLDRGFALKILSWQHSGFSVDNFVSIPASNRKARVNLSQYIIRHPVSLQKILYARSNGTIIYTTKYTEYWKVIMIKVKD